MNSSLSFDFTCLGPFQRKPLHLWVQLPQLPWETMERYTILRRVLAMHLGSDVRVCSILPFTLERESCMLSKRVDIDCRAPGKISGRWCVRRVLRVLTSGVPSTPFLSNQLKFCIVYRGCKISLAAAWRDNTSSEAASISLICFHDDTTR